MAITISAGGTYSGTYTSTATGTPAVTINTTAAVTLSGATIQHAGRGIDDSVTGVNLTVRNCTITRTNPGTTTDNQGGRAIILNQPASVVIENNLLDRGNGIWLGGPGTLSGLLVRYNRCINVGYWGLSNCCIQFFQADSLTLPDADIGWNHISNDFGASAQEDTVNLYQCSGTSGHVINVHHNLCDGAYATSGTGSGYTGGGIVCGDNGGSYVTIANNWLVGTSNYGVGITGGTNNTATSNTVVNDGYAEPGHTLHGPSFGQGLTVWDSAGTGGMSNIVVTNNTVGFVRRTSTGGTERANWWTPAATTFTGNTALADPIDTTDEQAARDAWEAARVAAGVTVGVTGGTATPTLSEAGSVGSALSVATGSGSSSGTVTMVAAYQVNSAGSDLTTLTTASFTPGAGEVLVLKATATRGDAGAYPTPTGGSLTWTLRGSASAASHNRVGIWTAKVGASPTAMTVSLGVPGAVNTTHSMVLERYSGADLAGSPAVVVTESGAPGAPSATLTCTAGSVLSAMNSDWNAVDGATRTYRTTSATPVETGYRFASTDLTAEWFYQPVAASGSQTFGLTAPTGQSWTLVGVEIIPATVTSFTRAANMAGGVNDWDSGPQDAATPTRDHWAIATPSFGAYTDTYALHAWLDTDPAGANSYARGLLAVTSYNLGIGAEVWYGCALYLLPGTLAGIAAAGGVMDFCRLDNFDSKGGVAVDHAGLTFLGSDDKLYLIRDQVGVGGAWATLTTGVTVSEGVWHWVEVHQRFATADGAALNEVYVDGLLVASSTTRNIYTDNPKFDWLRVGIVAIGSPAQTAALDLWADRATVTNTGYIGPSATGVLAGVSADATGTGHSGHLFYAAASGRWWLLFVQSATPTVLRAAWSVDLGTWTAAGTVTMPHSLAGASTGELGNNLGVAYRQISGVDVVHVAAAWRTAATGACGLDYVRATIAGVAITFATPGTAGTDSTADTMGFGPSVSIDSNARVQAVSAVGSSGQTGDLIARRSTNTDTGSAWTPGWDASVNLYGTPAYCSVAAALDLGGGITMALADSGESGGQLSRNILFALSSATGVWSPTSGGLALAAPTTATFNARDWGAVARTATDVHLLVRSPDTSGAWIHRRFNGTSWSAGSTVPTLVSKAAAGVLLASDGVDVWAVVIASAAGNTVKVCTWTAAAGTWGAWTDVDATTATRTSIGGARTVAANRVAVAWTVNTGTGTYSLVTAPVTVSGATGKTLTDAGSATDRVEPAGAYRQAVAADTPGAWWHLDETSGTSVRDGVGTATGTLVGGPTLGAASLATVDPGWSVDLENAAGAQYIQIPDSQQQLAATCDIGPGSVDLSTQGTVRTANSVATIVSQIAASAAGDTVQIAAGSYAQVTTTMSIPSGFIRIVPAPGATVSIAGVVLTNAEGLDWRGINTTGEVYYNFTTRCRWRGGTSTPTTALMGHNIRALCSDIVIEDVTVNSPRCGFYLYADRDAYASDTITIQRCRTNDVQQDHVFASRGTNVVVQDCEMFMNTESVDHSDGLQVVGAKGLIFRRNHVWCTRAFRDAAIDRNDHGVLVNGVVETAPDGSAGRMPENITIENNLIHDQTSHGINIAACLGIVIRNNTSYDNGLSGATQGLLLNTAGSLPITGAVLVNNVVNNLYVNNATLTLNTNNFVADNSGPVGTNRLSGAPGFVDNVTATALDYGLTAASQNSQSGTATDAPATDLCGLARPSPPSRGAKERPSSVLDPASITVEALIRAESFNGNNRIVQKGATDGRYRLLANAGLLTWDVGGHGTVTTALPSTGATHHVVGTYDAATGLLRLYVDGVQAGQTSGTAGAMGSDSDSLAIGHKPASAASTDAFDGRIDEVAIYPVALSAARILVHAQAAAITAGANPILADAGRASDTMTSPTKLLSDAGAGADVLAVVGPPPPVIVVGERMPYYFGRAGFLLALDRVNLGVTVKPDKAIAVHDLLSGRAVDTFALKRVWTLPARQLTAVQRSIIDQAFWLPGPYRLIDGQQVNQLSAHQSSGTEDTNDTTGFRATSGTLASSTAQYRSGARSLAWTVTGSLAAGNGVWTGSSATTTAAADDVPVVASQPYVFSFYARHSTGTLSLRANINWHTSTGAVISASTGSGAASSTGAWTRYTVAATAPATAAYARVEAEISTAPSAGMTVYLDDWQLEPGTTVSTWVLGKGVAIVAAQSLDITEVITGRADYELVVAEL